MAFHSSSIPGSGFRSWTRGDRDIPAVVGIAKREKQLRQRHEVITIVSKDRLEPRRIPLPHETVIRVRHEGAVEIMGPAPPANVTLEGLQPAIRKNAAKSPPGHVQDIEVLRRGRFRKAVVRAPESHAGNVERLAVERDPRGKLAAWIPSRKETKALLLLGIISCQDLLQDPFSFVSRVKEPDQKHGTSHETEGFQIEKEVSGWKPGTESGQTNTVR
jgi:hypothetical protein